MATYRRWGNLPAVAPADLSQYWKVNPWNGPLFLLTFFNFQLSDSLAGCLLKNEPIFFRLFLFCNLRTAGWQKHSKPDDDIGLAGLSGLSDCYIFITCTNMSTKWLSPQGQTLRVCMFGTERRPTCRLQSSFRAEMCRCAPWTSLFLCDLNNKTAGEAALKLHANTAAANWAQTEKLEQKKCGCWTLSSGKVWMLKHPHIPRLQPPCTLMRCFFYWD